MRPKRAVIFLQVFQWSIIILIGLKVIMYMFM